MYSMQGVKDGKVKCVLIHYTKVASCVPKGDEHMRDLAAPVGISPNPLTCCVTYST